MPGNGPLTVFLTVKTLGVSSLLSLPHAVFAEWAKGSHSWALSRSILVEEWHCGRRADVEWVNGAV